MRTAPTLLVRVAFTDNETMMGRGERYNRWSIRLKGYDHTRDGAYFVTICTHGRARVFGAVVNGEMRLNECGRGWRIVGRGWLNNTLTSTWTNGS